MRRRTIIRGSSWANLPCWATQFPEHYDITMEFNMLKSRLVHAIYGIVSTCIFAMYFTVGGFVLTKLEQPVGMPTWVWNLSFTLMMFIGLVGMIYFLFMSLDEIFFAPNDRRRITGTRNAPKTYKVTWRSR